jgi:hypothetical protein
MGMFPQSNNDGYRGAKISAWFLLLSGLLEFVPGCIHYFIPLTAATHIAHIDIGRNASFVLEMFSWEGSVQIPFGVALIAVALRYRTLVPLFLFLNLVERGLMSLAAWVLYPSAHHPPEHYASPVSVVLLAFFFLLSLRRRD